MSNEEITNMGTLGEGYMEIELTQPSGAGSSCSARRPPPKNRNVGPSGLSDNRLSGFNGA